MLAYGATLFLSAFLLFLVQPLIGKSILPWFGGAPTVWTTCMLFFQVLLLGGYSYAHVLAGRWPLRKQASLHMVLLLASAVAVVWFSIAPSPEWRPDHDRSPVLLILGLLAATIGAPFLLLSATAPLLQSWFSRTRPERFPYRLYALSNLGSLLAILTYPFLIEPAISLNRQATLWSWTYVAFVLLCGLVAWNVMSAPALEPAADREEGAPAAAPTPGMQFVWLGLTACSSVMLLATTSMLSMDLAVVPLLWILPLALYLLSFVICFQHERLYWRPLFIGGLALSIVWTVSVMSGSVFVPLRWQILSYSLTLFMVCMVCHGELVRLRPAPRYLTAFYLMVAAGGALGGLLVTVVATQLLQGFWEYHIGLLATTLLILWVLFQDTRSAGRGISTKRLSAFGLIAAAWLVLAFVLGQNIRESIQRDVEAARSFFGVLRVKELFRNDPEMHQFSLVHGRIEHGFQFFDPQKRNWPVGYYGPESGMGAALRFHPNRAGGTPMRIGVIGLGAGTAAAYGQPGDVIRFYEINPDVVRFSDKYFTYRKDSQARTDVVLGDARVSLERGQQRKVPELFDVLVIDAFSSDAIPVHLLTKECLDIYRYHLKPDGILAFHITSRYFNLSPVLRNLVEPGPRTQWQVLLFKNPGDRAQWTDRTDWVLMTANSQFLYNPEVRKRVTPWAGAPAPVRWTDDYSNLLSVIQERSREPDR